MGEETEKVTGGCMCGAVRYAAPEPHSVIYCHCRSCRRHTGAPVASLAGYLREEIVWSGETRKIYQSSPGIERGFCGKCGTPLTWEGTVEELGGALIEVFISTTDDPDALVPTYHIWHEERIKWFETPDNLPRYRGWMHDGSEPYLRAPATRE